MNFAEVDKIKSIYNENIELSSRAIDAILINGRQSRPDNNIPYHKFDMSGNRNFRFFLRVAIKLRGLT